MTPPPDQVIQQHQPRLETERRISELEQRLRELEETQGQLEERLLLRRRQFHVLLTSIHHLQNILQEGEEPVTMDTA